MPFSIFTYQNCISVLLKRILLFEIRTEDIFMIYIEIDESEIYKYRGSPPYADFGTWKKPRYAKFALVGL